jgi:hypothetical protein
LIDPADSFDVAHIIGVLRSEVTGVLGFNFSLGFQLFLLSLHCHQLRFGKDDSILCNFGFKCF